MYVSGIYKFIKSEGHRRKIAPDAVQIEENLKLQSHELYHHSTNCGKRQEKKWIELCGAVNSQIKERGRQDGTIQDDMIQHKMRQDKTIIIIIFLFNIQSDTPQ